MAGRARLPRVVACLSLVCLLAGALHAGGAREAPATLVVVSELHGEGPPSVQPVWCRPGGWVEKWLGEPLYPYVGGRHYAFQMRGERTYVRVDGGPPRLAELLIDSRAGVAALEQALRDKS